VSDMRCEDYRELVSAFVDERLDGAELLSLEAHIATCPGCRAFEVELHRFSGLLQAAEALRPLRRPPPGFAAMVASRAAAEPRTQIIPFPAAPAARRASRVTWLGLVAAAAVAALFFAWSWQRLLPGDLPTQRRIARTAAPVAGQAVAAADEGSMDTWMHEHAMLARGSTILGPAEEIEFASFRAGAPAER